MSTWGLIEDTTLTDIADALREKLDITEEITPAEMPEKIAEIAPRAEEVMDGVNFIDHDGVVLYSYTWDEIAELTELPDLPAWTVKRGDIEIEMTCTGWNWSLSSLQAASGLIYVGAVYEPADGYTHIIAEIGPGESMALQLTVSGDLSIDWDDGTVEALSESMEHTFDNEETELFDIVIYANEDGAYWYPYGDSAGVGAFGQKISSSVTSSAANSRGTQVKAVYLGAAASRIGNYGFNNCYALDEVTMSDSQNLLGSYALQNCFSLKTFIAPGTISTFWSYAFYGCYALQLVSVSYAASSFRAGVFRDCKALTYGRIQGTMGDAAAYLFDGCYSLRNVQISDSWTSIGTYGLRNCAGLTELTLPGSLTDIGNYGFYGCSRLYSIDGLSITSGGSYAFTGCYRLTELTNIGYIGVSVDFSDCPLSYDSLIELIEALAETDDTLTLTLNADCLALLSDEEIEEATNKGWTVTA